MNDKLFFCRFTEDRAPVEAVAGVGPRAQGLQDDPSLGGGCGGACHGGAAPQ